MNNFKFPMAVVLFVLMVASGVFAGNDVSAAAVDSGSFGIFVNKKRTATEKFTVEQSSDGSLVTTDFKTEDIDGTHQTTLLPCRALPCLFYFWMLRRTSSGNDVCPNVELVPCCTAKANSGFCITHAGWLTNKAPFA